MSCVRSSEGDSTWLTPSAPVVSSTGVAAVPRGHGTVDPDLIYSP